MNSESRICQNCQNSFNIEADDFSFYEKMKVPAPTFCPECRMIRRLLWRNNRSLHKRTCGLCNKTLISMYKDDGAPVFCQTCYLGDGWDQYENTTEIDPSIPFLSQIKSILNKQPRIFSIRHGENINSDYGNSIVSCKNAYLSFSCIENENIFFCENVDSSRNCFDCLSVMNSENCFWNINCEKNYNCIYMMNSNGCIDSSFLFDCVNCSNCFMSSNLRNQSYIFNNKKYSKEEYEKLIENYKLGNYSQTEIFKNEFTDLISKSIHRYSNIIGSTNSTGDLISRSNNISSSFDIKDSENISSSYRIIKSKDIMDCGWILGAELEYETMTGSGGSYNQIACFMCVSSRDIEYSISCKNCSNCFGCVGLSNSQYYILNKKYSKDEYEIVVKNIRAHMNTMPYIDQKERIFKYGEFFPYDMALFGYNESLANDFFPIDQNIADNSGFNYYIRPKRSYPTNNEELPNSIDDIQDNVLDFSVKCPSNENPQFQCIGAFKITPEELSFYRQKGLPLPRYCPNCRHYERLKYRNPMRLYKRACSNGCGREFETSYAPNRPEKVYCEKCYQAEVL